MQTTERGIIKLLFTQNKKGKKMLRKLGFILGIFCMAVYFPGYADEIVEEVSTEIDVRGADEISSEAIENYDMEGSLFEKITVLEQDKLVMQLEKERAQLDLEIDRLNIEREKIQSNLNGSAERAEEQRRELEEARVTKAKLEEEVEQLKKQLESAGKTTDDAPVKQKASGVKEEVAYSINSKYKLVNVIGIGNQLVATVENLSTGQNKRISVGKQLDGYTIKSISLNDGIVFEKDGLSENLSVGK